MQSDRPTKRRPIHRSLRGVSWALVALLLWLGGFGCATCCLADVVSAHCSDGVANKTLTTVSEASCAGSDSCCGTSERSAASRQPAASPVAASSSSVPSVSQKRAPRRALRQATVAVCALLARQTAATLTPESATVAAGETGNASFASLTMMPTAPAAPVQLPRNRSGTYLHCCALLI